MTTMFCAITSAAVVTASMSFAVMMVVMVAFCFRVIIKCVCKECLYSRIRFTADSAIQLYACLRQCHLGTASDSSADQNLYAKVAE